MTKINLFIVSILFVGVSSFAQLERGSYMLGGGGSFAGGLAGNTGYFGVSIQPRIGYFVANKFAVGAGLDFSYQNIRQGGGVNSTGMAVGLSPFARYYFFKMERPMNLFVESSVGLANVWGTTNGVTASTLRFSYQTSLGFVYFIRPQIGIEAKVQVGRNILNPVNLLNGPQVSGSLGFQIHLNRPKKE